MLESYQAEHNSQNIYFRSIVGAAEAGSRMRLGLQLRTGEPVRQVLLRLWQDQAGEQLVTLVSHDANAAQRFYTAWIELPDHGCLLWYYFIITMESGTYFYGNNAEMLGGVGALYREQPPSYQVTIYNRGAHTPDWFKNSVMYQIFPDRFARAGDTIVRKKGAVIRTDWTDDPMYLKDPDTKEIIAYDFFGGNLRGVMEKLDYLEKLGISCIYFNPVFESESNHHYDTGTIIASTPCWAISRIFAVSSRRHASAASASFSTAYSATRGATASTSTVGSSMIRLAHISRRNRRTTRGTISAIFRTSMTAGGILTPCRT